MAKVSVTINGIHGEIEPGKTLLEAAKEMKVGVAHLCFGNGLCSTCRVKVVAGMPSISEKQMKERVSLDYHLEFGESVRLACQARVAGPDPIVVEAPKFFRWLAPKTKSPQKAKNFNLAEAVQIAEAAKADRLAREEAAAKEALAKAAEKSAEAAKAAEAAKETAAAAPIAEATETVNETASKTGAAKAEAKASEVVAKVDDPKDPEPNK